MRQTATLSAQLFRQLALIFTLALTALAANAQDYDNVITLEAGPNLPFQLKEIFLTVQPGTVIELPAGTYSFDDELVLNTSHITIRGQGMEETILTFKDQPQGAQGILVLADAFVIEDLAIEDTAGDGLRIESANGVVIRGVRVEWTNGPDEANGAYGIYPVLCDNVLVEDSIVRGASDAGIYVGQSREIIVRRNLAEYNVAGIEIENSVNADVYENIATHNTGGILIFDMPSLSQAGHHTRVFNNQSIDNDTKNFAPEGNIVGKVPTGTGVMVLSTDYVDVFDNVITGNKTTNFTAVSFKSISLLDGTPLPDGYDPYPENISVRNNIMEKPSNWFFDGGEFNLLANLLFILVWQPIADIVSDGQYRDNDIANANQCYSNNTRPDGSEASYGNMRLNESHWLLSLLDIPGKPAKMGYPAETDCQIDEFGPVVLDFSVFNDVPDPEPEYTPEEIAQICAGGDPADVNWGAFIVNCPNFSDYRLFAGNDPLGAANTTRAAEYDLTSALFSDYAEKYRSVFVPPGTAAEYDANAPFDFPVGTIITKTFSLPLANNTEQVIETRLLIRRDSGWVGLPYVWAGDMSEAALSLGGAAVDADIVDPDGNFVSVNYRVPNSNQCISCHSSFGSVEPIGPKARWLNKDYSYGTGPDNQIDHWSSIGLLANAPAGADAPRLPAWDDPSDGNLEERARAYLEINCAHCHEPGGRAFATGLLLEASQDLNASYGVCKPPVAAGAGSGGLNWDIVPGSADDSILSFRIESNSPAIRMPELGRSVVHTQGAAVVREWIDSLEGGCVAE